MTTSLKHPIRQMPFFFLPAKIEQKINTNNKKREKL